jgi:transposase InsO family protein
MSSQPAVPLPKGWSRHVKSSLLHAISLASMALTVAYARRSRSERQTELDRARGEIALLKEELAIKDARWSCLPRRRRPHFSAIERMRILQVKAARGWSREEAAKAFMIDEETVRLWLRRADEEDGTLVRVCEPVNKFPDFVGHLVRQLKVLVPTMGKVRIAQVLARAGLHLGVTTVGRMLRSTGPVPTGAASSVAIEEKEAVEATRPNEVWHVDLTAVPTGAGLWVPWMPFALRQSWPFCWWVAVAIDQFSRAVVGFAVFRDHPVSSGVQGFLDRAVGVAGRAPVRIVTDRGTQFRCASFAGWCRRRGIGLRFGAVGRRGSIAVVERFIGSIKRESVRWIIVPLRLGAMRAELAAYVVWYNVHRPHQALGGRTPREVYVGLHPASARPRYEPREKWPIAGTSAGALATTRGDRGARLALVVGHVAGRHHLPVVELRKAA